MCLICVLLVVRGGFECERNQGKRCEDVVGRLQVAMCARRDIGNDDSGIVRWDRQQEKEDVLCDRDEGKVDDLEEPFWDARAEDSPAVIFVTTKIELGLECERECNDDMITYKLKKPRRHALYDNRVIQMTCEVSNISMTHDH